MPGAYIVDMLHDPRSGADSLRLPPAAVRLWDYFGTIVECASAPWGGVAVRATALPCRRRPGRQPCPGTIHVLARDEDRIDWGCPACGDYGLISHWQDSAADLSGVLVPGTERPDDQVAALVTPQESRALFDPRLAFKPEQRRILRAATPSRPGVRIVAPRAAWSSLVGEVGMRALRDKNRRRAPLLKAAWERLGDAAELWE